MIIRVTKTQNYTCVSNIPLMDPRLKMRDKGLLVMMLSKPDHWTFNTANMGSMCADGKDAINASIKSLVKYGYLVKKGLLRDDAGHITGTDYEVHEAPEDAPIPKAENPTEENPTEENPHEENPIEDFPEPENPPIVNTELSKYCNPLTPKGDTTGDQPEEGKPKKKPKQRRERKTAPDPQFDAFWAAWPDSPNRHNYQKPDIQKLFAKLATDEATVAQIMAELERNKATCKWTKSSGQYVPSPLNWLKERSWESARASPEPEAAASVKRQPTPYELVHTPDGRTVPYYELPPENVEQYDDYGITAWRWRS